VGGDAWKPRGSPHGYFGLRTFVKAKRDGRTQGKRMGKIQPSAGLKVALVHLRGNGWRSASSRGNGAGRVPITLYDVGGEE